MFGLAGIWWQALRVVCLMAAAVAVSLMLSVGAYAQAKPNRLAIVIGNSNYASDRLADLPNASNDATRLADALKRLNFDVATGIDFGAAEFEDLFQQYQPKLSQYDAVVIFYAGHGVQLYGENYLLPTDTPDPVSPEKLVERAVKLNDIVARFGSRDRQTFIFLDACRDNPLGLRAPGANNGLAQVEVGENTFVAFATQPGNVTLDGKGANSPFTTSLLDNVEIPGPSVSDMMIKVRNGTATLTLGRQVPWDQSNLREQFYFTEQQVLDPLELSSTLNRILAKPEMKERLVEQLSTTNSDLQSAVLILGKELADAPASADAGQPVQASLDLGMDAARKQASADIASLLILGEQAEPQPQDGSVRAGDTASPGENVATKPAITLEHRAQTELKRLGCYRMTVDGDWGPGSRRALGSYLAATRQSQTDLQPNAEVLTDLFLRAGRVCREPEAAPRLIVPIIQTVEKVVVQKQACNCRRPARVQDRVIEQPSRQRPLLRYRDSERGANSRGGSSSSSRGGNSASSGSTGGSTGGSSTGGSSTGGGSPGL
jgi:uncharacterized membrane protein YgcG